MQTKIILSLLLVLVSSPPQADYVFLKNGSNIYANKVWQDKDTVFASSNGNVTSFDAKLVKSIENQTSLNSATQTIANSENIKRFSFDVWTSWMNVEDIFSVALRNNLPLRTNGIISLTKGYKAELVTKYAQKSTKYEYSTDLLGRNALVILKLTPTTKRLHTVEIHWNILAKDHEAFQQELASMITQKYQSQARQGFELMKTKVVNWAPNNNFAIKLEQIGVTTILSYKDLAAFEAAALEENVSLKKGRDLGFSKDQNKF
jgi:hypothetical protein